MVQRCDKCLSLRGAYTQLVALKWRCQGSSTLDCKSRVWRS
jgi:hypothetical protein